jgi:hypothetical protein
MRGPSTTGSRQTPLGEDKRCCSLLPVGGLFLTNDKQTRCQHVAASSNCLGLGVQERNDAPHGGDTFGDIVRYGYGCPCLCTFTCKKRTQNILSAWGTCGDTCFIFVFWKLHLGLTPRRSLLLQLLDKIHIKASISTAVLCSQFKN